MKQGARSKLIAMQLLSAVAFCSATAVHARNWDWTYTPTALQRLDAHPQTLTKDSHGYWAIGDSVVHYHPDGTLDFVDRTFAPGQGASATLADGSLVYTNSTLPPEVVLGEEFYYCSVSVLSPTGIARWGATLGDYGHCRKVAVDGRDLIWVLYGYEPYLLSADGVLLNDAADNNTDYGTWPINDFVPNPSDAGVYLATRKVVAPGVLVSRVVSLDGKLATRWVWNDPEGTVTIDRLVTDPAGNVIGVGRVNGDAASGLHVFGLSASGQQRFVSDDASLSLTSIAAAAAAPDGTVYAIAADAAAELLHIDANGHLLWARSIAKLRDCDSPDSRWNNCPLVTSPESDVAVATTDGHLLRYDHNGTLLHDTSSGENVIRSLVIGNNGESLLTTYSDDAAHVRLLAFDRNGNASVAPTTTGIVENHHADIAQFGKDGSSYAAINQTDYTLLKLDSAGHLVWQLPPVANEFVSQIEVSDDNTRLCIETIQSAPARPTLRVKCLSAATGTQLWSFLVNAASSSEPFRLLADGSVVMLDASGTDLQHVRIGADGSLMHRLPNYRTSIPTTFGADGTLPVISEDRTRLRAYDRDGVLLYDTPIPDAMRLDASHASQDVVPQADGSMILVNARIDTTVSSTAWRVTPTGATQWLVPLTQPVPASGNDAASARAAAGVGDTFYVSAYVGGTTTHFQARSASSGALLWDNTNIVGFDIRRLTMNPVTGNFVDFGGAGFAVFDANSGAVVRREILDCGDVGSVGDFFNVSSGCPNGAVAIDANDTLRVLEQSSNSSASLTQVSALHHATTVPAPTRIDQPGLDGAWYPTYEPGQGFTFDYVANGNTLFMPWFTFGSYEQLLALNLFSWFEPATLSWYTLQGTVTPGATSADLVIARTDPGTFASGSVNGHVVGSAHLSFEDCANGTLIYQFDNQTNGGRGGFISLTRLTPRTNPCLLADGSTAAAQNPNPPAQGFDAKQSGSWYDPNTNGQGLELSIIPPGNGSNGTLFVTWFTFDPAGRSDDPIHQHWFTLQGDFAAASDGSVTAPIYRISGGRLDDGPTSDVVQVGHATLSMQGCDTAQFAYLFDSSEVAHAFAGLAGTSHLVKIGGCSTP